MSLAQSGDLNVCATYEKSDDPEDLDRRHSPDSPTLVVYDAPDGGFQAWATVFGS
jgi:hypothetical protein